MALLRKKLVQDFYDHAGLERVNISKLNFVFPSLELSQQRLCCYIKSSDRVVSSRRYIKDLWVTRHGAAIYLFGVTPCRKLQRMGTHP
jgi:hypothetical protein